MSDIDTEIESALLRIKACGTPMAATITRKAIRAGLAAAGLAIVPVEPTEAMMAPVHKLKMLNSKEIFLCGEDVRNCGIWKAMLRAAQERGE